MFLGFWHQNTPAKACLLVRQKGLYLQGCGVEMAKLTSQTDNGPESIGYFHHNRTQDGFGKDLASLYSRHRKIPPGQWSYDSDVETIQATIELEFYDLENFEGLKDFHHRVASYQAYYNLV